jgi:hypothetical protein
MDIQRTFHLHLVSDATGETLATIAKAVSVQYAMVRATEHLHPLVRSRRELDRILKEVEAQPGIVLYTLFNREMADALEQSCKDLNIPCIAPLKHVLQVFDSYLGMASTPTVGGQHQLDADYFRRIEAWHQPHVEDAHQHLSRQSRLQNRQCAARSRHDAAAADRRGNEGVCRGAGGEPGTNRASAAQPGH